MWSWRGSVEAANLTYLGVWCSILPCSAWQALRLGQGLEEACGDPLTLLF